MRDRARRATLCVGTGAMLALSLPPWGWWPLAFAGIAALDALVADRDARSRFARGWLVGMGLFVPSLIWMQSLTLPGYLIACLGYSAIFGAGVAACPARAPARWVALPGALAMAELLRWSWPFGGVPLSTIAIGQVDGPLAPVLRVGGTLLLLEVTVLVGVALAAAVRRAWRPAAVALALVAVLVAVGAFAPHGSPTGRRIHVALVQGGGPQGTRAESTDPSVVFQRHLDASDAVKPPVDVVFWPEDVVDVTGPVGATPEGAAIAGLARRLHAPVVVGSVEAEDLADPRDIERFRNAAVVFDASGEVVSRYEKVHRVPFGEFTPLRSLLEPLAGGALISSEAIAGDGPAFIDVPGVGRVATAISWEVFFGDRVREGVQHGAGLVANPTNGSSFTGTIVQTQQVAASRMRAIETGRWVVQIAPTGFSAIVRPDGVVVERSKISERRVIHGTVGLRTGQTLYVRLGLLPGLALALACLALAWLPFTRGDRGRGSRAAHA